MGSFGERLRREREMRGITIEEIAEATKIGSRNLRALEDEKFDLLPGGIFNKGFVRAYSKYLGLDEEQAVADYIAAETAFRDESSDVPAVSEEQSGGGGMAVAIAIVLVIVLAAAGFAVWKYYQKRAAEHDAQQTTAVARDAARVAPLPQPVAPPQWPPQSASQNATNAAQTVGGAQATTSSAAANPSSAAPTGKDQPASAAAQPATPADGFVVQLKANQDSWVSASADGKSVLSETLKTSTEKTLRAHERVVLTLGNAGGVQVSYNGKLLDLRHASGQVKTLVFTPQGLQPEVPAQR